MAYLPKSDGETHINVYTKGKTELGRLLTNLAETPTEIEFEGEKHTFKSLEGFWYFYIMWKHTKDCYYEFLDLDGFAAKNLGKELIEDNDVDSYTITNRKAFKARFSEALKCKLRQNINILQLLTDSELPFAHYYYYGDVSNPKVIDLPQYKWMMDVFEDVRKVMKEHLKNKETKHVKE